MRATRWAIAAACLLVPATAQAQSELGGKVLDLSFVTQDLTFAVEDMGGAVQDLGGAVQDLQVKETETEIRIELAADVLFGFDSADLQPQAQDALKEVADFIRDRAQGEVRIEGHTDAKGSESYNQQLSERRAIAVHDWLLQREGLEGFAGVTFATRGYGESQPVAPNAHPDGADDPDGRQKNRRVEIVIGKT